MDVIVTWGPKYGYHPKSSKCHLVVKDAAFLPIAEELFKDTGINITLSGERHLRACVRSDTFSEDFVSKKVENWVEDLLSLTKIAESEPQ